MTLSSFPNIIKFDNYTSSDLLLSLKITMTFEATSGTAVTTDSQALANNLGRHYADILKNCEVGGSLVTNCCGGYRAVDASKIEQTVNGAKLDITYEVDYQYNLFRNCPTDQYNLYYRNRLTSRNKILDTWAANGYTSLTTTSDFIDYNFDSQICDDLAVGVNSCPGNSVCYESEDAPEAECISLCNTTEYASIYGESYCKHDYPCCQADIYSKSSCQCDFYTSGYVSIVIF